MERLFEWLSLHASVSPYAIFALLLLAGMNIPISIDLLLIFTAFIAAKIAPDLLYPLYFSFLFGTIISAWICFSIGRFLGPFALRLSFIQKLLPESRRMKIQEFLSKYGLITISIGRFIPFGVRNCLFFTSGMSRVPFGLFAFFDAIAALVWVSASFYVYYSIADQFDQLLVFLKTSNMAILSIIGALGSVTMVWRYMIKRKSKAL